MDKIIKDFDIFIKGSRKMNNFEKLKSIQNEMDKIQDKNSEEFKKLEKEFKDLKNTMPTYHSHVWRKYDL